MHKIDGANHLSNTFQQGNPTTGAKGTQVTAAWLNAVQSELIAVLAAASIVPSKTQNAQLLAALGNLYAAKTHAHTIANVTGLQGALDAKTDTGHTHVPANITGLTEAVQDVVGGVFREAGGVDVSYDDAANKVDLSLNAEYVQDLVGAMLSGNSETSVTLTYNDATGKIDIALQAHNHTAAQIGITSGDRWFKLISGHMVQWGIFDMGGGALEQTVSIPEPFDSSPFIFLSNLENSSGEDNLAKVKTRTNSSFVIQSTGGNTYTGYFWLAVGK